VIIFSGRCEIANKVCALLGMLGMCERTNINQLPFAAVNGSLWLNKIILGRKTLHCRLNLTRHGRELKSRLNSSRWTVVAARWLFNDEWNWFVLRNLHYLMMIVGSNDGRMCVQM
jgi:hypothetical protein